MAMTATLAVLLTVHNRRAKTMRCLECLYSQLPYEDCLTDVYLTDDGCTDGTAEAVRASFPDVTVIKGDGNLYWNRGMHMAWRAASMRHDYDFYLWLNDDTFAYPYMLSTLLQASQDKGHEAIIVGATCSSDHTSATYGGRTESGKIPLPQGEPKEVAYFNGNTVLIPRSVFNLVGYMDYYFIHSKGDYDYGLRARWYGIRLFQTGCFTGECDRHAKPERWCDPHVRLVERWRAMYRPDGMPPDETFYMCKRHYGIVTALSCWLKVHLRCLCPSLWMWRRGGWQ